MTARAERALSAALEAQAERLVPCVHCGFCLPACPTYVRLADENDSPRGRLHLMRAVVEGRLPAGSDAFQTHIDRCLGCRACEPVCPSGVEYGLLLESARDVAYQARKPRPLVRVLLWLIKRRLWFRWCMRAASMVRGVGLARLVAKLTPASPRLHPLRFGSAMLAASRRTRLPLPTPIARAARSELRASEDRDRDGVSRPVRVALLTGCVQASLFAHVNRSTERVLRASGFTMVQVGGQRCCGALHLHAGDTENARTLARANVEAFARANVDYVVANAAGCGAAMKEYGHLLADSTKFSDPARQVAEATRDLSELLADSDVPVGAPVPLRVAYDAACHLCHAQGLKEAPRAVLRRIPELEVVPLPSEEECCGGAGIYGMTHPEMSGQIGSDKVAEVVRTGATAVVTANAGCIMQIGAGLLLSGSPVPSHHLVELLDESYRRAGLYERGVAASVGRTGHRGRGGVPGAGEVR